MNQPKDGRKLSVAAPSSVQSNPFIKAMFEVGLLPVNCRRFVIDSGDPQGVMTIHFDCFVDDRITDQLVIRSLTELKVLTKKKQRGKKLCS